MTVVVAPINQHKFFLEEFPHHHPLPVYIYETDTYSSQPVRINKLLLFLACARNNKNFRENIPIDQQQSIIVKLERSCYNQTIHEVREDNLPCSWEYQHFTTTYNTICTEKANNLDECSLIQSSYLVESLVDGTVDPSNVGSMTSYEMSKKIDDQELIEKKNKRLESNLENKKFTTLVSCPKCHKKKATFYEKQTRSGDEGKSVFYTCLECGKKWKES